MPLLRHLLNVRYSSSCFYHGDLNVRFKGSIAKKTGFEFL